MAEWAERWRAEDEDGGTVVNLEQLTHGDATVPGALILNVTGANGDAWASVPYADLRQLRDTLTSWLAEAASAHRPAAQLLLPVERAPRDDDPGE